jgi:transposase-like protein
MARRKTYSDKFKAGAIAMLQAQGYPDNAAAVADVARHLHVPGRTLRRWFNGTNGRPPDDVVRESKKELVDLFEDEIRAIMDTLPSAREDADYKDLVTGAAILVDKRELLLGKPTSRSQVDMAVSDMVDMNDDELDTLLENVALANQERRDPGDSV